MAKRMKVLTILMALCLIFAIGASAQVQNKKFSGPADQTYYMCTFVSGVEYWVAAFEGFKDAAKQMGVKAVYQGTTEYDGPKQVTAFEQIMTKKPAGIALSPVDDAAFIEPVKAAMAAKIPVVTFASDTSTAKVGFVTSSNEKEGAFAARAMGKELGGKGKVMVTRNTQTNHQIRVNTFIKVLNDEFPGIQVVAEYMSQQDSAKTYAAIMSVAQKHPDLGGIFSPEGPSGRAAAQAATELGGKIKVLCCDFDAAILEMIEKDQMMGAIQPNAYMQGYLSFLILYLTKNQMVDPLNGAAAKGDYLLSLPYVDNGLDLITKGSTKYFNTNDWLKRRNS
ncbi:MAG: substrate-binding domain-containing protein, partial [Spirochaetaceae bacterium]|nr:substrate-binding domain-containing protein [Spirochaetaceae bacterium]